MDLNTYEMVWVKGGTFKFQGKKEIKLEGFWMGKYPVTQEIWKMVMGENPSYFKGRARPVEEVSWDDICEKGGFLEKLNKKKAEYLEQLEGFNLFAGVDVEKLVFRLPTETEWEYAARGGNKSKGKEYAGSGDVEEVAWFNENSYGESKTVGMKVPNELGLHDMSGNVWEWCEDLYEGDLDYVPEDGSANNKKGSARVLRGGSWFFHSGPCRVTYRNRFWPGPRNHNIGLRLVLASQFGG